MALKVYASVHQIMNCKRGAHGLSVSPNVHKLWILIARSALKVYASVHPFKVWVSVHPLRPGAPAKRGAQGLRFSPHVQEVWILIARAKAQRGERERRMEAPGGGALKVYASVHPFMNYGF